MTESIGELIEAYRSTAIAWDTMRGDAKKANPLFNQLHVTYEKLRDSEQGQKAISHLIDEPTVSAGVHLLGASHSLGWEPEDAIRVLEAMERQAPGLYRTTARYTLKSFREGTLDLNW